MTWKIWQWWNHILNNHFLLETFKTAKFGLRNIKQNDTRKTDMQYSLLVSKIWLNI